MSNKRVTLSELRLLIIDTTNEVNDKLYNLQGNAIKTTIKELNGHEEILSKPYNFKEELEETNELIDKLILLRATLSNANNSTKIDDVDTIQSAINKLQEKRKLLNKVEFILENSKEGKQRRADGGFSNNSPAYYEIKSLNFDDKKLKEFRDKLRSELNTLEVKIQEANNSTHVEI